MYIVLYAFWCSVNGSDTMPPRTNTSRAITFSKVSIFVCKRISYIPIDIHRKIYSMRIS